MLSELKQRLRERLQPRDRGASLFRDLNAEAKIEVVFDVGANLGQSAEHYLTRFPRARIDCFEPVPATFEQLARRFRGERRVTAHQFGLGSEAGLIRMDTSGTASDMFRVSTTGATEVRVERLDDIAPDHIDFLKIDTEGHDFEVLKGGARMLSERRIRFLQVEAGMNPGNDWHTPMEPMKAFLEDRRYFLFGIYEQTHEWPANKPWLRRCNLVFVRAD